MRIYPDVTDVVHYFSHSTAVTGIQRVQLELIRHLSADPSIDFVIGSSAAGVRLADRTSLIDLVTFLDHQTTQPDALAALLAVVEQRATISTMVAEGTYCLTGAFWGLSSAYRAVVQAKLSGMRVGFLCYDLLPLAHPDYCTANQIDVFRTGLDIVLPLTDFAFAISEHVKGELETYSSSKGLTFPVASLPLAHKFAPAGAAPPSPSPIRRGKYVLFVSTIEPRKNHAYTLAVWRRLLEELPADTVPDLIWAGKQGWKSNALMDEVRDWNNLDGKLHILNRVSDSELRELYASCWFTIYPSHAEGWGLPVAESLVWGKPCIASNTSSIPEVGGDLVWYVDPTRVEQGVALVRSLISNPSLVEAAATRIRREFKPRTWADVAHKLRSSMDTLPPAKDSTLSATDLTLQPRTLYRTGS